MEGAKVGRVEIQSLQLCLRAPKLSLNVFFFFFESLSSVVFRWSNPEQQAPRGGVLVHPFPLPSALPLSQPPTSSLPGLREKDFYSFPRWAPWRLRAVLASPRPVSFPNNALLSLAVSLSVSSVPSAHCGAPSPPLAAPCRAVSSPSLLVFVRAAFSSSADFPRAPAGLWWPTLSHPAMSRPRLLPFRPVTP